MLQTSNFTQMFPGQSGHDPLKIFRKGAWPWLRDPLNFWVLNANNSNAVKATDFKFYTNVSMDSADISP